MKNPLIKTMLLSLDLKECYHGHAPNHKKRFKKKSKKINRNYNKKVAKTQLLEHLIPEPILEGEDLEENQDLPNHYDERMWADLDDPYYDDYYHDHDYFLSLENDYQEPEKFSLEELLEMENYIPF